MPTPSGRLTVLAAAALLCGCAAREVRAPERPVRPKARELRLGLVVTEGTRADLDAASARPKDWVRGVPIDPLKPYDAVVAALASGFRTVMKVESVAEARAAGADLVAALDMRSVTREPWFLRSSVRIPVSVRFSGLDGLELHRVEAEAFREGGLPPEMILSAADELRREVRAGLAESPGLDDLEKRAAGKRVRNDAWAGELSEAAAKEGGPLSRPSYRAPIDPESFAVVAGIEEYVNAPSAKYAERDAEAVRRRLLALGVPLRNMLFLRGKRADRSSLEWAVESWLPRKTGEASRAFFYFAGHGSPGPNGDAMLLPWDGDPKSPDGGYPARRLLESLAGLEAREVVAILDTDFTGTGRRSVPAAPGGGAPSRAGIAPPKDGRVVALVAASPEQTAGIDPGREHGLFTAHLIGELDGARGDLTLEALFRTAADGVKKTAGKRGRLQLPRLLPEGSSKASMPMIREEER